MAERLIFHYQARNSIIHRIDPRIKIIIIFTISAAMFTVNPLQFAVLFGYVLSGCLIARLPFARYKKELRFFLLLLVIIVLSRWISSKSLIPSLYYGARFILVVAAGLLLTDSTAPEDLTLALYWFLRPFKFINPKRTAIQFNLTVSFIPIIFDSVLEIREARKSRLDNTWRKPVKRIVSFSSQIFDLILQKAEEISYALESRLFDEKTLHGSIAFRKTDFVVLILTMGIIAGLYLVR
ncbi:MAG: energy-coupling factor transporter transmembrane protein EcfT [Phycisphaerae bacterium]|nr:energy-coupling factor transporter transmembrane protein EcfT [Phycisphaerae bacterium]